MFGLIVSSVLATVLVAFGYSLWAIAGAGYEVVFKGFLLLPPIPDKPPVTR